jgi:hypothetical protein
MADGVLLTADAARRIAAATRKVEGTGPDVPGDSWYPYVPDEAEGVKLCKTTATWAVSTSQELDEYTGTPGSETAATPPVKVKAYNRLANLPAGMWVLVASVNGGHYLLAFSLTQVGGYSASKQQVLGHSATGDLAWLDTTACT